MFTTAGWVGRTGKSAPRRGRGRIASPSRYLAATGRASAILPGGAGRYSYRLANDGVNFLSSLAGAVVAVGAVFGVEVWQN